MNSGKQRIYVGNLPFDTTETEVFNKFSKYGNVVQVEMKHRSDPYSDVGLPCYAFLDMHIDSSKIERCFRKLSGKKWNGHSIKLELAKESFLSRLEKEREETNTKTAAAPTVTSPAAKPGVIQIKLDRPAHHKQISPVDVGGSNKKRNKQLQLDDITPPEEDVKSISTADTSVIKKFESFSDVWKDPPTQKLTNGKIIKHNNLSKGKQCEKEVHHGNMSEAKRLKSMEDKKKSFLQQKEAVKLALSSVDSCRPCNKRIIFDDDDDEDGFVSNGPAASQFVQNISMTEDKCESHASKKPRLFEENESADEEAKNVDFKIKKQFEGKKGQKLLELQSQYASDQRFALDERFYDSDDNGEKDDPVDSKEISSTDEVKRQLEILENIVGHELPRVPGRTNAQKSANNFMLRFDPTNVDHAKYEIKEAATKPASALPSKAVQKKAAKAEKKKKEKSAEKFPEPFSQVSKDTFYKVSENLTESLKTKENGGFSILKMFGSGKDVDDDDDIVELADDKVAHRTSVPLSKSGMDWLSNPFKHDSSDSESEEDVTAAQPEREPVTHSQGSAQACGLWRETFFFKTDDDRLSEGLEFFSRKAEMGEDFSQRRRELRQIVNAKVKHNVRKSQPKKKKLGGNQFSRFRDTKKKNRVGTKVRKFRKK